MSIIEKIYEAFIAGKLSVKPEKNDADIQKLFKTLYEIDAEQAQELERFVFDIADKQGKSMFAAGFKLAVELIMNSFER